MRQVALLLGVVLLLAACGGGGGAAGTSAAVQIKQVWTKFFSAKTPVSEKPALLQDGARFRSAIASLASNQLASGLSAKVSSVTLEGSDKAKVVFSVYLGSIAALSNQVGYAFKENGKWLVGYADLCKLISLQPGATAPAACKS